MPWGFRSESRTMLWLSTRWQTLPFCPSGYMSQNVGFCLSLNSDIL